MATLDLNNSYWAQKLLRFKDAGLLLPARLSAPAKSNDHRREKPAIQIAEPANARPHSSVYAGALALLVAKYSAKEEVLIAAPIAKDQSPLFYRCVVEKSQTVDSFVAEVEAEIHSSRLHQPYSFKDVAALLEMNEQSVFQISFSAGDNGRPHLPDSAESLTLLAEGDDEIEHLSISYDTQYYAREWVRQFINHYQRAVSFLTENGFATLGDLDLLSQEEKHLVAVQFNDTSRDYPSHKTLHSLLEEQAANTPNRPAIVFRSEELTYREMNEKANTLARFLRESLRVRTGDIVGVMMTRSEKMIVSLIAIMKAGAAYVPINPKHPWATINYMIENAGIRTLLVDTESVPQAATFDGELFIVDVELDGLNAEATNPNVEQTSSDLAYVIYTSGSTGLPKGVAIEHSAIVNTVLWRNRYYAFDEADVNLQMPSFAFDSSVLDIFCVLVAGGCLVIPQEELRLDAQYLKETIFKHGVTRLLLTPSYYRVLMRELGGRNPLRSITVAGEATTVELVEEHSRKMPGVTLYNEYGPTENAVCTTACVLRSGCKSVSIGRPIDNVKVFIMDECLKLLPVGVTGEIYLGGVGLARGYLNQEAMTEERFIPSPIPEIHAGRLYRTGDWGYWKSDGELEFVGRVDNQVKIRGFRIEIDEVETRLLSHPDVEHGAVVCKETNGNRYLAAYLAARRSLSSDEMRDYLRAQLPYYMVPEVITVLSQLPLTLNGKVDRARLKGFNDWQEKSDSDLPEDEMERAITAICCGLLQGSRLSVSDNFFDHGLNSLKVMEMVSKVRNEIGIDISLLDVYTFPTIQALSRRIGDARWNTTISRRVSTT